MRDLADGRERQLMVTALAVLAVLLGGELYHHLSVKPVTLPTLLFELLEVVLLIGCTVTCTLLIQRVRALEMAAATAVMLALLLTGELYLGVTPPMLLLELLEVVLLVGGASALVVLVRRTATR